MVWITFHPYRSTAVYRYPQGARIRTVVGACRMHGPLGRSRESAWFRILWVALSRLVHCVFNRLHGVLSAGKTLSIARGGAKLASPGLALFRLPLAAAHFTMNLLDPIVQFQADIREIRRDLHAHPELRFEEQRTSQVVAENLEKWGIPVIRGLGGTGVVGTIQGRGPGGSIGLRADMDALPLQESNSFGHRSKIDGRMHACGHDGHTAMLLGAARYLAKHRNFDGTVYVIFQPAEEGGAGAQRMIEDGLFDRFPCDAVFGMHNWPGMPVGRFGVRPGPMMASSNEFEITVFGKGAHAALPHLGVDPVIVATHLVQAFQTIVSRNRKPIDAAVLSVTQIHVGDASNIIADTASIGGTVRTFSLEVLDLIENAMRRIVETLPAAFEARAEMRFDRSYPPTVNHAFEAELVATVLDEIVGPQNVLRDIEPVMGAEDFSFMLLKRPGAYLFIGNGDGVHRDQGHGLGPCTLHNPSYDFNDDLLPIGATVWARLAELYLAKRV